MTCPHGHVVDDPCGACVGVRLTSAEVVRQALAPFARLYRDAESRGLGDDLAACVPVPVHWLRAASWALEREENNG